MTYTRKYDFQPGTKISSSQIDEEFDNLIGAVNNLDTNKETKSEVLTKVAGTNWYSENGNGTFHRLQNGTQICQFVHKIPGDGTNFRKAELFFPAAFLSGSTDLITVHVTAYQNNAGFSVNSCNQSSGIAISESKYRWLAQFPVNIATDTIITVNITAVGRWK